MKELFFNAFLGIGVIFYMFHATLIAQQSLPADVVEANGFPLLVGGISLVLIAFTLWENIKTRHQEEKLNLSKPALIRIGIILTAIFGYIQLVTTLGFITTMFVFLAVCITAGGSKRYIFNVVFALILTIFLTLVFGQVFMISLPRGTGIFFNWSFLLH